MQECQQDDWKEHKKICKVPEEDSFFDVKMTEVHDQFKGLHMSFLPMINSAVSASSQYIYSIYSTL